MDNNLPSFEDFPKLDYILQNPPEPFTEGEQQIIADLLTHPIIKRYFNVLLWNQIRDLAGSPIPELGTKKYKLQHAYVKGCIGMLITLSSIEKAVPKDSKLGRK